jgi:DNA-binding beta-propeller fold protein YncE
MKSLFTFLLLSILAMPVFGQLNIQRIGGIDLGSAEILAYDAGSQRLFSTSGNGLLIVDFSDPANPSLITTITPTSFGAGSDEVTSVAVKNGIVAIAVPDNPVTDPGNVYFLDANGALQGSVTVGALPDMLTFSPDGTKVLVANEGEPDNGINPEGSISIIDISGGAGSATVATAGLGTAPTYGPVRRFEGTTQGEDLEPEYIVVSADGSTAYAALQEANSIAVIDVNSATTTAIVALGFKDHSLPGNGIDASDRDGDMVNIQNYPVFGMYMPDGMASYSVGGNTFILTANEGDDRGEDERIKDLDLDPTAFPNAATLQLDENMGRLGASTNEGDTDGDGDYDELYVYGARSFSIWNAQPTAMNQVFDSGDQLEQIIAAETPALFNADEGDPNEIDNRSDNKGPEPEAVKVVQIGFRTYALVGLERVGGGFLTYDITDPVNPTYLSYTRDDADIALEDIVYIPAVDSPNGENIIVTANEETGTLGVYSVEDLHEPIPTMAEWNLFLFGLIVLNLGLVFLFNQRRVFVK